MKKSIVLLLIATFSCQTKTEQPIEKEVVQSSFPESMQKIFKAHGGYEKWSQMQTLSYQKGSEQTIANLKNRKIRVTSDRMTIGFDGNDVWVMPDSVDARRARFYHNLYFYFYAMPFVLGDPGIQYEDVADRIFKGKNYSGLKISYEEGIGDSPKDNYILWFDPETFQMQWLMYTVTFSSGEANDRYNLIKYDQWGAFDGLVLPTTIQWYRFQNDTVGGMRNEVRFENIQLSEEAPDETLFEMPQGAQIAPFERS
jgi:hypothetical protein